jgi:hypothetical protein
MFLPLFEGCLTLFSTSEQEQRGYIRLKLKRCEKESELNVSSDERFYKFRLPALAHENEAKLTSSDADVSSPYSLFEKNKVILTKDIKYFQLLQNALRGNIVRIEMTLHDNNLDIGNMTKWPPLQTEFIDIKFEELSLSNKDILSISNTGEDWSLCEFSEEEGIEKWEIVGMDIGDDIVEEDAKHADATTVTTDVLAVTNESINRDENFLSIMNDNNRNAYHNISYLDILKKDLDRNILQQQMEEGQKKRRFHEGISHKWTPQILVDDNSVYRLKYQERMAYKENNELVLEDDTYDFYRDYEAAKTVGSRAIALSRNANLSYMALKSKVSLSNPLRSVK